MRGVYPGTFNPPTIGHLAIAEAAIAHHRLAGLDLVISRNPLAKSVDEVPSLEQRIDVIEASVAHLEIVRVEVTDHRLIADIATGYDVVVMGTDKWRQINDVGFYDDHEHRDTSIARLPRLAIAARDDDEVADHHRLVVPTHVRTISSSAARQGRDEWMTEAARKSGWWNSDS